MHTRTLGRPGCHACRHRTGLWTYATEALAGEASAPVRDHTVIALESGWRIEHRRVAGPAGPSSSAASPTRRCDVCAPTSPTSVL